MDGALIAAVGRSPSAADGAVGMTPTPPSTEKAVTAERRQRQHDPAVARTSGPVATHADQAFLVFFALGRSARLTRLAATSR